MGGCWMCSGMSDIVGRLEAMAAEIKSLRALLGRWEKPGVYPCGSAGLEQRDIDRRKLRDDTRAALAKGEG